jgi:hypothetical protein
MRKIFLLCLSLTSLFSYSQTSLIAYGDSWKYLANGVDQGTGWRSVSFNDNAWPAGNAEFGYGDGGEATVLPYGSNPKKKYMTSYFRKTISISDASLFGNFTLNLKRDDGAVVYINGVEQFRSNMPSTTISYNTKASSEPADDGNTAQTITLPAGTLVTGTNVIAVELHQSNGNGTDLSFNLQLLGNAGSTTTNAVLTRGPYLQMVNGNAATLRWRTDIATDSRLEIGTAFGTYPASASVATLTTEHEVRITGLAADTKYYYRFGSSTQTLQQGSDNFFTTAPGASVNRKIRIAAFGDCGRNDNGFQAGTLTAYQNYTAANPAEVLLLLGDNAYDNGLDAEYQSRFFSTYSANILKNHALFPAPGNHDYANNSTRQNDHNIPYYSIFSLPSGAECGGVASNTEAFYSFDWGNIHFLSLDSYGKENSATRLYDTTGPQALWVKADLAANSKKWTVAYWHHPPYTMGSHNSDTESELVSIRNNFIRILERYGVDMIICGHSHDYERSYLLKDYFGTEASFNLGTHAVSSSSGKYDGSTNSCPYTTVSGQVNHGTVYIVAGSAGADGGVQAGYPHNALPFSVDDGGMLFFEVEDNRLDAKFIRRDGAVADQFTIVKDAGRNTSYTIPAGSSQTLTASWNGTYSWPTGETTRSITVSPASSTSYIVSDANGCLKDTFNITVEQLITKKTQASPEINGSVSLAPTFVKRGQLIRMHTQNMGQTIFIITGENGNTVKRFQTTGDITIETSNLSSGIYFLKWETRGKTQARKFVVAN